MHPTRRPSPSKPKAHETEAEAVAAKEIDTTEAPLSSLDADALKALCGSLNDQINALHGEGKHEEADALRPKHMHAQECLRMKTNPTGYA